MELTLKRSIQHVALCVDRVLWSIQHVALCIDGVFSDGIYRDLQHLGRLNFSDFLTLGRLTLLGILSSCFWDYNILQWFYKSDFPSNFVSWTSRVLE